MPSAVAMRAQPRLLNDPSHHDLMRRIPKSATTTSSSATLTNRVNFEDNLRLLCEHMPKKSMIAQSVEKDVPRARRAPICHRAIRNASLNSWIRASDFL